MLRPGKFVGFAGITAKPVSEKFPDVFMLEKIKSLVVTSEEFLHGRMV